MKLVLSTHKVTLTDSLKDHVHKCVEKIEHQDAHVMAVFVNLERAHKGIPKKKFKCTMKVTLSGQPLIARDSEADLYTAIDMVTKKVQAQLRKRHSKFKALNHKVAASAKRSARAMVA